MPAPRSSSGSPINPAMIKVGVAVVALAVAGTLVAYQLGWLGGNTAPPISAEAQKAAEELSAKAKAELPPAPPPDPVKRAAERRSQ